MRGHLRRTQADFSKGDFSSPSYIHGEAMRGLVDLRAADPGEVTIACKNVAGGAEFSYRTTNATLVAALHA